MDYTTVIGVDRAHLQQLRLVWPTWLRHKPSLFKMPLLVFFDKSDVDVLDVVRAVKDHKDCLFIAWPPEGVAYPGDPNDKWTRPQRSKMLAGFVHVPGEKGVVRTPYILKLDTDVIATGQDDWIDPSWFGDTVESSPAIISHAWTFTRPADQMDRLDEWVSSNERALSPLAIRPPLNLHPLPGASRVGHRRIISFCGFFRTDFVALCSLFARTTCGEGLLPVPSQDGFLWYCAQRLGYGITRVNMRGLGWMQRCSLRNIQKDTEEALRA